MPALFERTATFSAPKAATQSRSAAATEGCARSAYGAVSVLSLSSSTCPRKHGASRAGPKGSAGTSCT